MHLGWLSAFIEDGLECKATMLIAHCPLVAKWVTAMPSFVEYMRNLLVSDTEVIATRNRDPGASTRATHAMPPNPRYLLICFEYFAFSIGSDFTISWATQCWRLRCEDSRRKQTTKNTQTNENTHKPKNEVKV